MGDPPGFWECYTSSNTANLDWRGQKEDEMKDGWLTPQILKARNRLIKLHNYKHMLLSMKKVIQKNEAEPEAYPQALKPNGVCPAGFANFLGTGDPFLLSTSPFWTGLAIPGILCLSHCHISEVDYLFHRSTEKGYFCSKMDNTQNPTHTWFRLFRE